MTLTIKDGKISVDEIGPSYETPRYPGWGAIENGTFDEQIEAAQGDAIDGVTMATLTSGAIKLAAKDALTQAAAEWGAHLRPERAHSQGTAPGEKPSGPFLQGASNYEQQGIPNWGVSPKKLVHKSDGID